MFAGKVTLSALVPDFDFVIAADRLTVAPQAATALTGVPANPSPSVTVLARTMEGPALTLTCAGMRGTNGANGEAGESGIGVPKAADGRSSYREETGRTVWMAGPAGPGAMS